MSNRCLSKTFFYFTSPTRPLFTFIHVLAQARPLATFILACAFFFSPFPLFSFSPDPILYQTYDATTDKVSLQAPLNKLLALTHLTFDGTAKDLIKVTQSAWMRPKDKERWEIDELSGIDREAFLQAFDQLGMLRAIEVPQGNRDLVILGGASSPAMKKRLTLLVEGWQRGDRYKKIAILTGDRPMDPRVESDEITALPYPLLPWKEPLTPFPNNEKELGSWLVNHIVWPKGMHERFLLVGAEKSPGSQDKTTFIHTLRYFRDHYYATLSSELNLHPTALLISSQPHAHIQHLHAIAELGDWLQIELAAYSCPDNTKISVMLDALARWIYASLETTRQQTHLK